jgi:excisionase family DNA binding protein
MLYIFVLSLDLIRLIMIDSIISHPIKKHKGEVNMITENEVKATITVKELAKAWGISLPHAWRMVHDGTIPAVRLGRRYIISRKVADGILNKGLPPESK